MGKKAANDNVRVMVRVRPFNKKEIAEVGGIPVCTLMVNSNLCITAIAPPGFDSPDLAFPLDHVFWSMPADQVPAPPSIEVAEQEDVYNLVGIPQLESMFDGYNGCIFAYGQTSSGKTHSMMGYAAHGRGITPRLCEDLFKRIGESVAAGGGQKKTTYVVKVAFLEIYNEKVQDLLVKHKGKDLKVIQDPTKGPVVMGLTEKTVTSWEEVEAALDAGMANRSVAATAMNDTSSRSHAVVQLAIDMEDQLGSAGGKTITRPRRSRANLVDLAGSEKVAKSKVEGAGLKEAIGINQSLTCLGRVIDHLVDGKPHIPYRDSVLTCLLSDSLGGNSRTTMLAALSPAAINYEETVSTLRYASRARKITNKVKVNEDPTAALIRELQDELAKMKQAVLNGDLDSLGGLLPAGTAVTASSMGAAAKEVETLIANIRELEEKEAAAEEERQAEWEERRMEIEEKHEEELNEIQNVRDQLREQKAELEQKATAMHADVKTKQRGLILNKLQGLTRLAAAKETLNQREDATKEAQAQMIVGRLRSNSSKEQYKTMARELKAHEMGAREYNAHAAQLQAELAAAQETIRRIEESKGIRPGQHIPHGEEATMAHYVPGQPYSPMDDPRCVDCQRRADVQCPQCNNALLCNSCNETRHAKLRAKAAGGVARGGYAPYGGYAGVSGTQSRAPYPYQASTGPRQDYVLSTQTYSYGIGRRY